LCRLAERASLHELLNLYNRKIRGGTAQMGGVETMESMLDK